MTKKRKIKNWIYWISFFYKSVVVGSYYSILYMKFFLMFEVRQKTRLGIISNVHRSRYVGLLFLDK